MDKIYNRHNFHNHTYCVFKEVEATEITNRKPNYKSKSGSSYYFTEEGVYRLSNHWGRAANCKWRIESDNNNPSRTKLGFALWTSFHADNDIEKLYYIDINFEKQTVSYNHRDNGDYNGNALLRTASETTKIIKQIRQLLDTDAWAKYKEGNIEDLRRTVIEKLINTNVTLAEIKRNL